MFLASADWVAKVNHHKANCTHAQRFSVVCHLNYRALHGTGRGWHNVASLNNLRHQTTFDT